MFLALLALKMVVTNDNHAEFMNVSRDLNVFAKFYSHLCGHCRAVYPTWENFTQLYENDTQILIAECDCVEHNTACDHTGPIHRYPTFLIVLRGEIIPIRIDRTIESFSARAEEIKAFNPDSKCRPDFGQADNYPYLLFSFPEENSEACGKLLALSSEFPNLSANFLLGPSKPNPEISVILDSDSRFTKPGPLDHESRVTFVKDYSHLTLTSWPLSESHQITLRRFGFVVYVQEYVVHSGDTIAYARADFVCLGLQNLTDFNRDNPTVELTDQDMPALALTNQNQTRFMLIKKVQFDDDLSARLTDWLSEPDHPEMIFPYKYYVTPEATTVPTVELSPPVELTPTREIEVPDAKLPVIMLFAFIAIMLVVCATARRRLQRILKPLRAGSLLTWLSFTRKDPAALD
jgi:thiol-disulfide isomerase/thioredoxin